MARFATRRASILRKKNDTRMLAQQRETTVIDQNFW
jgi:hypothetical protein